MIRREASSCSQAQLSHFSQFRSKLFLIVLEIKCTVGGLMEEYSSLNVHGRPYLELKWALNPLVT